MRHVSELVSAGLPFVLALEAAAHPAPLWSLALTLRGPQAIDLASAPVGAAHRIEVAAATTATWVPGRYFYQLRATDGADVAQLEDGRVEIRPDLAAQAAGFDGRSHVERVLAAVEAVIENRATIDQSSYSINNRSLARTPLSELLALRSRYRAELARQGPDGRRPARRLRGRVVARFG